MIPILAFFCLLAFSILLILWLIFAIKSKSIHSGKKFGRVCLICLIAFVVFLPFMPSTDKQDTRSLSKLQSMSSSKTKDSATSKPQKSTASVPIVGFKSVILNSSISQCRVSVRKLFKFENISSQFCTPGRSMKRNGGIVTDLIYGCLANEVYKSVVLSFYNDHLFLIDIDLKESSNFSDIFESLQTKYGPHFSKSSNEEVVEGSAYGDGRATKNHFLYNTFTWNDGSNILELSEVAAWATPIDSKEVIWGNKEVFKVHKITITDGELEKASDKAVTEKEGKEAMQDLGKEQSQENLRKLKEIKELSF